MATIQEVLNIVDETPNSFSDQQKVGWINELEGHIKTNMTKQIKSFDLELEEGKHEYTLPKLPFDNQEVDEDIKHQLMFYDVIQVNWQGVALTNSNIDRPAYNSFYSGNDNLIYFHNMPTRHGRKNKVTIFYEEPFMPYAYPEDADKKLIAPPPYDSIYSQFCLAKIDWHNREYDNYNNTMALYNATMDSFMVWYKRRNPIPKSKFKNYW